MFQTIAVIILIKMMWFVACYAYYGLVITPLEMVLLLTASVSSAYCADTLNNNTGINVTML